jgi:hypothetical protein
MTINSTIRKAGPFIGNGGTTVFSFAFKVFTASDLLVVRLNVSTSIETTLVLNSDYTVTLNLDQDSNPGGSITLLAGALATGYNMIITSDIADLQQTDLTNQGGFYPDVINDALDRATIQIQQLQEELDRSIKVPVTEPVTVAELTADLIRVANSADNVDIVANHINNVDQVADSIDNVDTVAPHVGNIDIVAPHVANIDTVAASISNVDTAATNIADINTVAADLNEPVSEIQTVADNITNVNAVGNNIANVNAVAGNATNINTVAGNTANINTVAGNNANVTAVGSNIASVNSAATNMAAIIAAPVNAAAAAASAAAASNSASVALSAQTAAVIGAPGVFASTTAGLSNGVMDVASIVGGSAGTNGTFDVAFSGGSGTGAAARFMVAGGALTKITITNPGTGYTSAPTMSFAASSGLTGASATAVIGARNNVGEYFSVPASDSNESMILYRVDAGPVATEVKRYPSSLLLTWTNEYRLTAGSQISTEKVVDPAAGLGSVGNSVYQNLSVTAGDVVDVWLTVKAAGRTIVNLYNNGGATMNLRIDLERGLVLNLDGSWPLTLADINPLGNDWWLVHVVKTVPSTGGGNLQFRMFGTGSASAPYGGATYTGDGTSGVYVDSLLVYNRTSATYPFASPKLSAASWTKLNSTVAAASVTNSYTLGGQVKLINDTINEYKLGLGSTYSTTKIVEGSGTVSPSCYTSVAWTNGGVYTINIKAKAAERKKLNVFSNGGLLLGVTFDLETEIFSGFASGQTGSFARLGNGWYAVVITGTATQSTSANLQIRMADAAGNTTYTGDGSSGLYIDTIKVSAGTIEHLLQTQLPANAFWIKQNITVTAVTLVTSTGATKLTNLVKAIGDLTGDKFVEASGATMSPSVYRSFTFTSGSSYLFGGDFKKGERNFINLYCNGGAAFDAIFDLDTGTVASGSGATITSLGGGWYRCQQTVTASASTSANLQLRVYPSLSGHPYAGNGSSGLYANDAWIYVNGGSVNQLSNSSDFGTGAWSLQNVSVQTDVMPYGGVWSPSGAYIDPGAAAWVGKRVSAIGTSITAQAQYTVPLATNLSCTLTNLGTSGGSIASGSHYGSLYIYNAIASIASNAEVVLVEAGINDFGTDNSTLGSLGDTTTATFYGAIFAACAAIRTQAPNAKIVFLTPFSGDSRTSTHRILRTNSKGYTLQQFQQAVAECAGYCGFAWIDVGRESGIGYHTGSIYLGDGLHLNATGGIRYANYVAEELRSLARGGYLNT